MKPRAAPNAPAAGCPVTSSSLVPSRKLPGTSTTAFSLSEPTTCTPLWPRNSTASILTLIGLSPSTESSRTRRAGGCAWSSTAAKQIEPTCFMNKGIPIEPQSTRPNRRHPPLPDSPHYDETASSHQAYRRELAEQLCECCHSSRRTSWATPRLHPT